MSTAAAGPTVRDPSRAWWVIVAASIAVFMATLDMTIVAVALPSIGHSIAVSPQSEQWLLLGYGGAMVALILPAGRWIDRVDLRRTFALAVIGFAVASTCCGISTTFAMLIGFRLAQGAFGALISALVPVLAFRSAPPQQRGRAMGLIGTVGPLGAVTGPGLGGLLIGLWSWRAVFFVNIPISLVALGLGMAAIARTGDMHAPRWDVLWEAATAGGTCLAVFGVLTALASSHPSVTLVVALSVVAIVAGTAWWMIPTSRQVREVFGDSRLGISIGALLFSATAGGALIYLPPFVLERIGHLSPSKVGLVTLAMPLAMAAFGPVGGYLADRAVPRMIATAGLLIVVAGSVDLLLSASSGGAVAMVIGLTIAGVGNGLFAGPIQTDIMSAAPHHLGGTVGAASSLGRQVGFTLGPALATLVWTGLGNGTADGLVHAFSVPLVAAGLGVCLFVPSVLRRGRAVDGQPSYPQAAGSVQSPVHSSEGQA